MWQQSQTGRGSARPRTAAPNAQPAATWRRKASAPASRDLMLVEAPTFHRQLEAVFFFFERRFLQSRHPTRRGPEPETARQAPRQPEASDRGHPPKHQASTRTGQGPGQGQKARSKQGQKRAAATRVRRGQGLKTTSYNQLRSGPLPKATTQAGQKEKPPTQAPAQRHLTFPLTTPT